MKGCAPGVHDQSGDKQGGQLRSGRGSDDSCPLAHTTRELGSEGPQGKRMNRLNGAHYTTLRNSQHTAPTGRTECAAARGRSRSRFCDAGS